MRMVLGAAVAVLALLVVIAPVMAREAYTANGYGVSLLKDSNKYDDGIIKACDHAADGYPLVARAWKNGRVIGKVQDSYGGRCDIHFLLTNASAHDACLRLADGSIGRCGSKSYSGH